MKRLKELLRAKRAFSPVIASLILMLLAVAAGVVVYAYVMGWLGSATQTAGGTRGQIQFDSIYASSTTGNITLYVVNVGQKELTIQNVYVDGAKLDYDLTDSTLSIGEVSAEIDVDPSGGITEGVFYEVRVTCTDGTTTSQSVEGK